MRFLCQNFQKMSDPFLFFNKSYYSLFLGAGRLSFFKTFICTPKKTITNYRPNFFIEFNRNTIISWRLGREEEKVFSFCFLPLFTGRDGRDGIKGFPGARGFPGPKGIKTFIREDEG